MDLSVALLELVRRCATSLPPDVVSALAAARDREEGSARSALAAMLDNLDVAGRKDVPLCQDTGAPIFWVHYPEGWSQRALRAQILGAIREATARSWLRPNAVDPLTGRNSGDNTGAGVPILHLEEWDQPELRVDLLLKGGGSENVSAQYKLPDTGLKAGRDLEGVRRVVVDAVFKAQGQGCAPGLIGVGIGGNRDTGYEAAKRALLRPLDQPNPEPALDALERRLTEELNTLDIGPMGFGGHTTVLGVRAATAHRLPACFFVSVAYLCWAARRNGFTLRGEELRYDY